VEEGQIQNNKYLSGFCSDKHAIKMPNSQFCSVAKTSSSNLTACISIWFLVG